MRILKKIIVPVLLLVTTAGLSLSTIYPWGWTTLTKKDSLRLLTAAQTTNELAQAVGPLGVILTLPNDAWMAIRYRDSHAVRLLSLAVVRDSGGAWFESERHFCAKFAVYAQERRRIAQLQAECTSLGITNLAVPSSALGDIHRLASSANIEVARSNLVAMGFRALKK